ncbi:MAG: hypothetical protein DMF40_16150 [Verrucomicrobia bacterium]|nr:MAG: hypothetical protein DMF40_16150 [Verrucomicrobiota bacterium]
MPWVYVLKGSSGRHYIGSTVNLDARLAQHFRGHTATTKRLGEKLEIVAKKEMAEVRELERILKRKKIPSSPFITSSGRAAPKAFGVGREFDSPPWQLFYLALSIER